MGKVEHPKTPRRSHVKKRVRDGTTRSIKRKQQELVLDIKTSKRIICEAKRQKLEDYGMPQQSVSNAKLGFHDAQNEYIDERELYDDLQIQIEDGELLNILNNSSEKTSMNSSKLSQKIINLSSTLEGNLTENISLSEEPIDHRIQEMYEGVRDIMKKYRSGKLPKAFKIIPKLKNWDRILLITDPFNWSAASIYQGTRLFASALSESMAQKFYNLVLLPRIRDDLCEYKKLNIHMYNALQKALFKPGAFMKGIIIPLLESGDCTLRESIIFGSIIAKCTIPTLHSSACLMKICEMEYSGANSIFIRILVDKRYALPYRVIDAAVHHFLRFEIYNSKIPMLWHQSFLTFVQRYKNDISTEQKEALFRLLRKQFHPLIGPEIRRELQASRCRNLESVY